VSVSNSALLRPLVSSRSGVVSRRLETGLHIVFANGASKQSSLAQPGKRTSVSKSPKYSILRIYVAIILSLRSTNGSPHSRPGPCAQTNRGLACMLSPAFSVHHVKASFPDNKWNQQTGSHGRANVPMPRLSLMAAQIGQRRSWLGHSGKLRPPCQLLNISTASALCSSDQVRILNSTQPR
jgi:hypothetical protein